LPEPIRLTPVRALPLFGTIHSTGESALEIARRAAQSIRGSKAAATELGGPFDLVEKANITAATLAKALDRDHDTFDGVIAPENRRQIESFIASLGYPAGLAHHLKPWFLAMLTAAPACEIAREARGLPEVDQFLAKTAKDSGVKVIGLETVGEQLDAIAALSPCRTACPFPPASVRVSRPIEISILATLCPR
jgi:uncharacterized protein